MGFTLQSIGISCGPGEKPHDSKEYGSAGTSGTDTESTECGCSTGVGKYDSGCGKGL